MNFEGLNKGIPSEVVFVCKKPLKSISITTLLKKIGCKVEVVSTLYDAFNVIDALMPRLILSEYEYTDGNLSQLIDKLRTNPLLKDIPIVSISDVSQPSQTSSLEQKGVAKIVSSKSDARSIIVEVHKILQGTKYSNFELDVSEVIESDQVEFSMNLSLIGKVKGLAILASDTPVALNEKISLQKAKDSSLCNVEFNYNFVSKDRVLSFAPIHKICGKEIDWFLRLNDISDREEKFTHKLAIYSKNNHNATGLQKLLNTQGYEASVVLNYDELVRYVSKSQKLQTYGVVVDMVNDEELAEVDEVLLYSKE